MFRFFALLFITQVLGQTGTQQTEIEIPLGLSYNAQGIPSSCCGSSAQLVGSIVQDQSGFNLTIPAAVDCNNNIQEAQWYDVTFTGTDGDCSVGKLQYSNQYGSGQMDRVVIAEDSALGTYSYWFFPWNPTISCSYILYSNSNVNLHKCTSNASFANIMQPISFVTHAE